MSESVNEQITSETEEQRKFRYKAGAFLVGVAGNNINKLISYFNFNYFFKLFRYFSGCWFR